MTIPRYFFEHGSFYFRTTPTDIRFMCQRVSIIYDAETATVLKHGSQENIAAYMMDTRFKQMQAMGIYQIRTITFDASSEAANWINDTLATSGSIVRRIEHLQSLAKQQN